MAGKSQRQQFEDWLLARDWDVFGTLKFQPIKNISAGKAHTVVRHFVNKLDRVIYGKAAECGVRVQRWCFAHEGSASENYHVHFVAKSPIEPELFCCLSNVLWTKHARVTGSIKKNWFTPVISRQRVAAYLTKEFWKLGEESFDAMISADKSVIFELNEQREMLKRERIARAMTENEFRAAHAALIEHKVRTEQRLALRDRKESGKATCY
jgi:hypothetical protein